MLLNVWSTDPTHKKDYYKVLGVSPNADQKQIKKAYFDVSITFYFWRLHYDSPFIISPFPFLIPIPCFFIVLASIPMKKFSHTKKELKISQNFSHFFPKKHRKL